MITNIDLLKTVPEGLRTADPAEKLEARHPLYSEEDAIRNIRSNAETEEHFALCLEGKLQEARSKAGSGLRLEEAGDALAILGHFDEALSIARGPALELARRQGILFVLVIELFRRNRIEEPEAILSELESAGLGAGDGYIWPLRLLGGNRGAVIPILIIKRAPSK